MDSFFFLEVWTIMETDHQERYLIYERIKDIVFRTIQKITKEEVTGWRYFILSCSAFSFNFKELSCYYGLLGSCR